MADAKERKLPAPAVSQETQAYWDAAAKGKVSFVGTKSGYGNVIEVSHGNGMVTRYAHLSAFGQLGPVQAGDEIGYVGATGNAGGPHDHFEWHPENGRAVDPHEFLMMVCDSGALPF